MSQGSSSPGDQTKHVVKVRKGRERERGERGAAVESVSVGGKESGRAEDKLGRD